MAFLNPYWAYIKYGAILIVFAIAVRWVYGKGYDACELQHMKAQQTLIDAAVDRAAKADDRLRERLSKIPTTGRKVNDAVRDHPSNPACIAPDAPIDVLQDGIDAGKADTA